MHMYGAGSVLAVQYDEYGGPSVLSLRRITPPSPRAGEVLVEVHAVSVNPVDWKVRSGMLQKFFPITFPATTGRDGAGKVIGAASATDEHLVGERVCFLAPRDVGTWSERIALPASMAVPIPPSVPYEQAASLPLAGIAAMVGIVQTAKVDSGMRVLIHAAGGGVGSLAVQIARANGATVVATCSGQNVDFVRSLGATEVIPYDQEAFEEKVGNLDVVFDLLGSDVHRRSYKVLKHGGLMVCLAAAPFDNQGVQYGVKVECPEVLPDRIALTRLIELVVAARIRPCVEHVFPLSEFARVQQISETGHARGKTVLAL
jgi:NADPH:quinone reductase-like Zn-dependent oxidoreductase